MPAYPRDVIEHRGLFLHTFVYSKYDENLKMFQIDSNLKLLSFWMLPIILFFIKDTDNKTITYLRIPFKYIPAIATENLLVLFLFSLFTTCFGPYGPSSGEIQLHYLLTMAFSRYVSNVIVFHLKMARRDRNMLWTERIKIKPINSQLWSQVYIWKVYVYITQQDAPHKDKKQLI
jgi:hypothetical protein